MLKRRPIPRRTPLTRLAVLLVLGCGGSGSDPGTPRLTLDVGRPLLVGAGATTLIQLRDAGTVVPPSQASWTSDAPEVAQVNEQGRVTAVSQGSTLIRAEWSGSSAVTQIEVFLPTLVDPSATGMEFSGRNGYVTYIPGTLPLVFTSPHGGALQPNEIPDRTFGVTGSDRNTLQLTLAVRQALIDLTGHAPHVILSQLHRVKLDPNREIVEAAQGSVFAEQAWSEFQGWAELSGDWVEEQFGSGLYIDMHGHGHPIDRLELGYLLFSVDLALLDGTLDNPTFRDRTSIRALGVSSPLPFSQLLRGPTSLGAFLATEGIPSVPSPAAVAPAGQPYFSGGFNTVQHGSRDGGMVSGVQFEHHFTGLRDTGTNRAAYAERLARVLRAYMLEHYGFFEPAQ